MNQPRSIPTPPAPEPLTVRFVRQLPNEEAVFYARRCAQKTQVAGPLTIVLEAKPSPGRPMHEVRLEQNGQVLITESDPEILLAIRNAFDRLAMETLSVDSLVAQLSVAAPAEPSKLWS